MPRSRNIKPAFFTNDDLADCEPLARLLFIGLWCLADCDGRLKDKPRQIKAQILPYDNVDSDSLLINLDLSGFIQRYTVLGQPVIQIVNFTSHQNPHKNEREKGSVLGTYEDRDKELQKKQEVSKKSRIIAINPDKDGTAPEERGKRKEERGKRKEGSGKRKDETLMSRNLDGAENIIIDYLNKISGKTFKPVEAHKKLIFARIKEGHSIKDLKNVIDYKTKEWGNDPKMSKYIRPATLFNAEKFNQYVGELGVETPEDKDKREIDEWLNEGMDNGIHGGNLYEQ